MGENGLNIGDNYRHADEATGGIPDVVLDDTVGRIPDIDAILDAVHLPGDTNRRLRIHNAAKERLLLMGERMHTTVNSHGKSAVAIIRAGGKDMASLEAFLQRQQEHEAQMPILSGILLMINPAWDDKDDQRGKRITERCLEAMYERRNPNMPQMPIVPMRVEGGWDFTVPLNGGIAVIEALSRQRGIDSGRMMVAPMSFDVKFPTGEARRFNDAMALQDHVLTARLLPDGSCAFPHGKIEIETHFHKMLSNPGAIHNGHLDLKNAKQEVIFDAFKQLSLGRNTAQALGLKHLVDRGSGNQRGRGGFNRLCNGEQHRFVLDGLQQQSRDLLIHVTRGRILGMEDRDFWSYLRDYHIGAFRKAMGNVVNYHDLSMTSEAAYSAQKAEREIPSVFLVADGAAKRFEHEGSVLAFADGRIPQALREFRMGNALRIKRLAEKK